MIEIYVDIYQTQDAGMTQELIIRPVIIERSYITGVRKVHIEEPRQLPAQIKPEIASYKEAEFNGLKVFGEGQVYAQLSRNGRRVFLYVTYNIAGPGQAPIYEWIPFSSSRAGEINSLTGTVWRNRQGNRVGEAL